MLDCIIIDDEQFSIDTILDCIKLIPRLNVTAIYQDPREAIEKIICGDKVDLIFMDINMPHISGLELAKELRPQTSRLVFTTAHSRYAFEAYEADGEAFLLKPYTFAKFNAIINRLFPFETSVPVAHNEVEPYFMVKSKSDNLRILKIYFDEVIAFESELNYIKIHIQQKNPISVYLTITDILELVKDRPLFRQFHRSFVISTKYIKYIERYNIVMENKLTLSVGRTFKNDFAEYISGKLLKTARNK